MREKMRSRSPGTEPEAAGGTPSRQARRQVVRQMQAQYRSTTEGAAQEYLKTHRQERGGQ